MSIVKLTQLIIEYYKSIDNLKGGLVEIKNDKDGNLALSIGRKSFSKVIGI